MSSEAEGVSSWSIFGATDLAEHGAVTAAESF